VAQKQSKSIMRISKLSIKVLQQPNRVGLTKHLLVRKSRQLRDFSTIIQEQNTKDVAAM